MKLLLDTHSLIWALSEPEKLSKEAADLIKDSSNIIYVSIASLWELQIKKSLNKIELPDNFSFQLKEFGYEYLAIIPEHIAKLDGLPMLHRDPFDRILIAQSLYESLKLVTRDVEMLKYTAEIVRA